MDINLIKHGRPENDMKTHKTPIASQMFSMHRSVTGKTELGALFGLAGLTAPILASADVMVDGNTISWPDDGNWYQVQSADTYENICEGGNSCTVDSGVYNIINLTTGERFLNVSVTGTGGEALAVNAENARALINQAFEIFTGRAYDQRMIGAGDFIPENVGMSIISQSDPDVNNRIRLYSCTNGGAMGEQRTAAGLNGVYRELSFTYCQVGNDVISGVVDRRLPIGNNESLQLSFDNHSVSFEHWWQHASRWYL